MDLITSIKLSQGQLMVAGAVLLVVASVSIWVIAKEIYYAVHPDKRPMRRKPRK